MAMHSCEVCDRSYKTERGLEGHMAKKHPPEVFGTVAEATDESIAAAAHLTPMDAGAVAVLRRLARTIDGMDEVAASWSGDDPPPFDNVTVPTYLKYAEALGLTVTGRLKLGAKKDKGTSKLADLRSIQGGRAG
jgi:hypothetical protein